MIIPSPEELLEQYERIEQLCAKGPDGPGRAMLLGWDLEYTSPTALLVFIDQILFRGLNDFVPENERPVIVDCGANIGYTALHYKRLFPGARVIALEPDPRFLPLLQANLQRNGAADVRVVPAAAWINDGEAPWVMERKDGSHLGWDTQEARTTVVPTVDLRTFLADPVDFLKLDIEGAEFEVVPHLAPVLHRVHSLVIECHVTDQTKYSGLARVMETLTASGFQISVNSFGPWRDLVRRHVVEPPYSEQYVAVYGWRGDRPPPSTEQTFLPYVGITHFRDVRRSTRVVDVDRHSSDVGRTVLGLLAGRRPRTVHRIAMPVAREGGYCWSCQLPAGVPSGDSLESQSAMTLLLEDERALGPGHALHDHVQQKGGGLYLHWNRQLYFSASDNSDPNTNGRVYTIVVW
jgi:FkbM family methyltransferase